MQFGLENQHREFFNQQGWIEFEDLVPPDQLSQLNQEVESALCKRLAIAPHNLSRLTPEALYLAGRDLWRDTPAIKKLVIQRRYAQMAAELTEEKPLRLGYDQALFSPTAITGDLMLPQETIVLPKRGSLSDLSSIQGMVCGLCICLQSDADAKASPPLPTKPGNALFLSPKHAINLEHLWEGIGRRYFLITYSKAVTLFVHQANDANRDKLRAMGYNYGDRVEDHTHPIVYR